MPRQIWLSVRKKLPNTFENYLLQLSKKNRHEIRRKIRKFENNLEFEIIETDESNVDEHLLEFLRLMKLNPEKRNFLNQSRIEFMSRIIKYGILSKVEGLETANWVLIDSGDILINIFRPEVREYYQLEKMWMI